MEEELVISVLTAQLRTSDVMARLGFDGSRLQKYEAQALGRIITWPGLGLGLSLGFACIFFLLSRFLIYNIYLYIKCYLENKLYNAPKMWNGILLCVILLLIVFVLYRIYKKCAHTKNE